MPGTWAGSPQLTYNLYRNGVAVPGRSGLSLLQANAYIFTEQDIGCGIKWKEIPNNNLSLGVFSNELSYDSPTQYSSSLHVDDGYDTLVSGKLSARADRSGNGYDMVQTTVSARCVTGSIVGITAPDFDSSIPSRMDFGSNIFSSFFSSSGGKINIIFDDTGETLASDSTNAYDEANLLSSNGAAGIIISRTTSGVRVWVWDGSIYRKVPSSGYVSCPPGRHKLVFTYDGATLNLQLDDGTIYTNSWAGTIATAGLTICYVGRNYTNSSGYNGRIGLIASKKTQPTTNQTVDLNAFLKTKYQTEGWATGVRLSGSSQYYRGTASSFTGSIKRVVVRWRPNAQPANALRYAVGMNTGGGGSAWSIFADNTTGGGSRGFVGAFQSSYAAGRLHIMSDGEIGRLITDELVCSGSDFIWYRDGAEFGRVATTAATFGTTNELAINTKTATAGTLGFGDLTVFEIQHSLSSSDYVDIVDNAKRAIGYQISGACHLWVASDLGSSGSVAGAWLDRISSVSLTASGAPILESAPISSKGAGSIECFGDSITVGNASGGSVGNGYRKALQDGCVLRGRSISMCGQNPAGNAATQDFDPRHSAVASQALGVVSGPVSRLSTLLSDSARFVGAAVLLMYGTNDLSYRVATQNMSATQASDAFFADIKTAIETIRTYRTARIIIPTVLRQGTGSSIAATRTAIDTFNATIAAQITELNRKYENIVISDICSAATPNQSAADDAAVLYDGTHPSPATYGIIGDVHAAALCS